MRLDFHNRLGKPQSVEATRLVGYDLHGNPILLAFELQPGHYRVFHARDPEFAAQLELLGVKRTTLVTR